MFSHITLDNCPGLATLLFEGERLEDLMKLSPEQILLRWVNHHLERAGIQRRCNNLQSDISDSEIYSYLLKQIAPQEAGVTMEAIHEPHLALRAELMLQQAAKLNCRSFVTPQDVTNGVYKLNLAFVANLFNNHPGLDQPEQLEGLEMIEETREEKSRNSLIEYTILNYSIIHCLYNLSLSKLDEQHGSEAIRELAIF